MISVLQSKVIQLSKYGCKIIDSKNNIAAPNMRNNFGVIKY